jgi:transposase
MVRRLAPEVVHRIMVRLQAGEAVPAIAKAIKVHHKTVYKIQLNLDIYGEPYAPASVVQGRPKLLLAYQELVSLKSFGVETLLIHTIEAT